MSSAVASDDLRRQLQLAPLPLIAARIRRARRELDLTHDQAGERIPGGMTRQQLIKFEKAKNRPRLETLLRIAEGFGRDPEWFVNEGLDPSPFPGQSDGNG